MDALASSMISLRYIYLSSSLNLHSSFYILPRCLFDSMGRGESRYEIKDGATIDIHLLFKLREGNTEELLNIILYPGNLTGNVFPFPCKVSKLRGDDIIISYGFMEHMEKKGDCFGIFFIRLCLSQRHLHEVGDKKRVYYTTVKPVFSEEEKEVDVVAPRGFLAYEDFFFRKNRELTYKSLEPFFVHTELTFKDDVFIPVDGTYREGILGDIDTDKDIIGHSSTSITDSLAMAGDTSTPILHDDNGSLTQPTYHGFWRQVTDSFEGLLTQDLCSYPALPYVYYTDYTRSYKDCNINS